MVIYIIMYMHDILCYPDVDSMLYHNLRDMYVRVGTVEHPIFPSPIYPCTCHTPWLEDACTNAIGSGHNTTYRQYY